MRFFRLGLLSGLLLAAAFSLHAEDPVLLTFFNGELKNNYRVVFEQWDGANHFASGAVEISSNDEDKVHTRISFSAEVKADPKDKKTEVLAVRCTPMLQFFPPADKKEPYPPLTWKIIGRKTKEAVLKATFWNFGKNSWVTETMEFEKAEK